jgi:hypothetical protein
MYQITPTEGVNRLICLKVIARLVAIKSITNGFNKIQTVLLGIEKILGLYLNDALGMILRQNNLQIDTRGKKDVARFAKQRFLYLIVQ